MVYPLRKGIAHNQTGGVSGGKDLPVILPEDTVAGDPVLAVVSGDYGFASQFTAPAGFELLFNPYPLESNGLHHKIWKGVAPANGASTLTFRSGSGADTVLSVMTYDQNTVDDNSFSAVTGGPTSANTRKDGAAVTTDQDECEVLFIASNRAAARVGTTETGAFPNDEFPTTSTPAGQIEVFDRTNRRYIAHVCYSLQVPTAGTAPAVTTFARTSAVGSAARLVVRGAEGLPKLSTLQTNFDEIPPFFSANYGNVSVVNGEGHTVTDGYSGFETAKLYSFEDDAVFVRAKPSGTQLSWQTSFTVSANGANNRVEFLHENNNLVGRVTVGGAYTDTPLGAYNATTRAWWRIREEAGTVYFDASPDAYNWTNLGAAVHGLDFSVAGSTLGSGKWNGADPAGPDAIWDSFNILPIAPVSWDADLSQPDLPSMGFSLWQTQTDAGAFTNEYDDAPPVVASPGGRPDLSLEMSVIETQRRSEVVPDHRDLTTGDSVYFSQAFYLPANFPLDLVAGQWDGFRIVDQIHQAWGNWSPPVAFEVADGYLKLTGGNGLSKAPQLGGDDTTDPTIYKYEEWLTPISVSTWYNLIYFIDNFSEVPGESTITVWLNGTEIYSDVLLPPTMVQGDADHADSYRKIGLYQSNGLPACTIYQAGHAAGMTYAEVDPYLELTVIDTTFSATGETATLTGLTGTKSRTLAGVGGTESPRALARSKSRVLGRITELSGSSPLDSAKTHTLPRVQGREDVRTLGRSRDTRLGRIVERGSPVRPGYSRDSTFGSTGETVTVRPLGRARTRTLSTVAEINAAGSLGRSRTTGMGTVREQALIAALSRSKSSPVGQVRAGGSIISLTGEKTRTLARVAARAQVHALARAKARTLGVVAGVARLIGLDTSKIYFLGGVLAENRVAGLSASKSRRFTHTRVSETTRSISSSKSYTLGQIRDRSRLIRPGAFRSIQLGQVRARNELTGLGRSKDQTFGSVRNVVSLRPLGAAMSAQIGQVWSTEGVDRPRYSKTSRFGAVASQSRVAGLARSKSFMLGQVREVARIDRPYLGVTTKLGVIRGQARLVRPDASKDYQIGRVRARTRMLLGVERSFDLGQIRESSRMSLDHDRSLALGQIVEVSTVDRLRSRYDPGSENVAYHDEDGLRAYHTDGRRFRAYHV